MFYFCPEFRFPGPEFPELKLFLVIKAFYREYCTEIGMASNQMGSDNKFQVSEQVKKLMVLSSYLDTTKKAKNQD